MNPTPSTPIPSSAITTPSTHASLLVVCLCAQWCGTCKDYQPVFERLHAEFAGAEFRWVDVEDQADRVDPVEVDNFPTLLIAVGDTPYFFGTLTPHAETLRRLIQSYTAPEGGTPAALNAQTAPVDALLQRLRAP